MATFHASSFLPLLCAAAFCLFATKNLAQPPLVITSQICCDTRPATGTCQQPLSSTKARPNRLICPAASINITEDYHSPSGCYLFRLPTDLRALEPMTEHMLKECRIDVSATGTKNCNITYTRINHDPKSTGSNYKFATYKVCCSSADRKCTRPLVRALNWFVQRPPCLF